MPIECAHLLASGQKCKAPAVSGSSLCRHHHPGKRTDEPAPFVMPPIQDQSGLLFAVTELLEAMSERRIKRSDAGTFLFGIQLAAKLMSDIDKDVIRAFRAGGDIDDRWASVEVDQPGSNETIEDARAFLADAQNTSAERALERWLAKDSSPSQRPGDPLSKRPIPSAARPSAPANPSVKPLATC